ncbi:glycoside hydrolase family 2 TIM barrel-domain containing protein [Microbacterium sp. B2969]|uniref:Glycoside hydrolase family 2 TIM barrel-domain containing protein n=1 Tax=Microbacterium alkaliflavum TaxID=3248839 RepID=A0ABW7Q2H7_9MICO
MTVSNFNDGWRVGPNVSVFTEITGGATSAIEVTLPHDAMLALPRHAGAASGPSSGYFEGGAVSYRKEFDAPAEWADRVVELEFQGVYRDAMVYLNGILVGQRPNGYSPFRVRLDAALRHGETNRLRVDARAHRDSRWYSGLGIYRDVILHDLPVTHIVPDGIRVTTPDVDADRAVVEIAVEVANAGRSASTRELRARIVDASGIEVAAGETPVTTRPGETATARLRLYVRAPELWSVPSPVLYRATVELSDDDDVQDESIVPFGIRTLQLDPQHGLRINGVVTKLRGACIHHDNGVLGAVSVPEAEERRIRILKGAGFNAIRSSHNTASPALLDACDRLGMLVIDEAFDMWTEGKQPFDYSLSFTEWWERDIEAMVRKAINHPSVIVYSIGNEILDAGKPLGAAIGRDLAEAVRRSDPTRFLTNGVSGLVATLSDLLPEIQRELKEVPGGINDAQGEGRKIMDRFGHSDSVTEATAESHAVVDIAGHNYATWRYESEIERFPNRVVVGTETNPKDIADNWAAVTRLPSVIGDFTWTGWDYLGEAGLGGVSYPEAGGRWDADRYPALLAYCGDIDITGHRRPASYFREIVFGLRSEPYLAVHAPRPHGREPVMLDWGWTDSAAHWSWPLAPGTLMTVDVYSDADEVELVHNGASIGRLPAGPAHGFLARFTVAYEPGRLDSVNRRGGEAAEVTTLRSPGAAARLRAEVEAPHVAAATREYEYVSIEVIDQDGLVVPFDDRLVRARVAGELELTGLGSARPSTEESYRGTSCTTFQGRAQAVVRRVAGGRGELSFEADGLPTVRVVV